MAEKEAAHAKELEQLRADHSQEMDRAKLGFEEMKELYNREKIHLNARMAAMKERLDKVGEPPEEEVPEGEEQMKNVPLKEYNNMLKEMVAHREIISGYKLQVKQ